jgi:hypothetical protein
VQAIGLLPLERLWPFADGTVIVLDEWLLCWLRFSSERINQLIRILNGFDIVAHLEDFLEGFAYLIVASRIIFDEREVVVGVLLLESVLVHDHFLLEILEETIGIACENGFGHN